MHKVICPSCAAEYRVAEALIRHGDLEMDLLRYEIRQRGKPVNLAHREFQVLQFFMERPNRVWSMSQLYEHIWGYDASDSSSAARTWICALNRKLDPSPIKSVHGFGYILRSH